MQAEHKAAIDFIAVAFGRVLTSIQKAKALVISHPHFPDVMALATAAHDELGGAGGGVRC